MNMKERWNRFWTLDRHHAAGFTLVELIVVIAILAILAGIGIPSYSNYIEKASMQADITLISEIVHAAEAYGYSVSIAPESTSGGVLGYAVVTNNGTTVAGEMANAMQMAFGNGYETLALKWDGWNAANSFGNGMESFVGSSYETAGTGKLLNDVQYCAGSLGDFLRGSLEGTAGINALDKYLGGSTYVKDYLDGMEEADVTADVLSNAVVFGLADKLTTDEAAIVDTQNKFSTGYYLLRNWSNAPEDIYTYNSSDTLKTAGNGTLDGALNNPNLLADVANTYAALEAFSAYSGIPMELEFDSSLSTLEIVGAVEAECDRIMSLAWSTPEGQTAMGNYINFGGNASESQAAKDAQAYLDVLGTVNDLKYDYKDELVDTNMFGSKDMENRVNGYVAVSTMTGDVKSAMQEAMNSAESTIAVVFTVAGDGTIGCTVYESAADARY